ncbi:hypothetical protein CYMTET_37986 [Cymbomonas tetramitiformis]|uniref:Uncharacterized protein n=1 Tax=Cymbomonas tetramitiformis TaxID=36881 RepID=A0AAE0CE80_9CHLO|nr:hypothetical protein CYMTET_37986 [Cymbomonas tetramitiformis]
MLGDAVGDGVGELLGDAVGEGVGDALGDGVGDMLGDAVGDGVGELLGMLGDAVLGEIVTLLGALVTVGVSAESCRGGRAVLSVLLLSAFPQQLPAKPAHAARISHRGHAPFLEPSCCFLLGHP